MRELSISGEHHVSGLQADNTDCSKTIIDHVPSKRDDGND